MIAEATAPWWGLILQALILIGVFAWLASELFSGVVKFIHWLGRAFRPSTYQTLNVYMEEHRDPTRPRSWEDEMESRFVVAERMRQLENPKPKGNSNA